MKENCHETQFENTRVKHRQSANLIIRVVFLHGEKVRVEHHQVMSGP